MKQIGWLLVVSLIALSPRSAAAQRRTLDIYFIDVEGGQATLVVTPGGQTLLIDTGFPGDGTFASIPAIRGRRVTPTGFSPRRAPPA